MPYVKTIHLNMTVPTVQCLTEIELLETTTKLHQIGGIVLIISAVQHDLVKRAGYNYSFPPRSFVSLLVVLSSPSVAKSLEFMVLCCRNRLYLCKFHRCYFMCMYVCLCACIIQPYSIFFEWISGWDA